MLKLKPSNVLFFIMSGFVMLGTACSTLAPESNKFKTEKNKYNTQKDNCCLNSTAIPLASAKPKSVKGFMIFMQKGKNLEVSGNILGLSPGKHGIHVHENGNCSDSKNGFKKAGGHYNPNHSHHASILDGHMGDLGNIIVDNNGHAQFNFIVKKFNIIRKDPESILRRSIIIHEGEDDEKTDPAGNSGERILCGVVKN